MNDEVMRELVVAMRDLAYQVRLLEEAIVKQTPAVAELAAQLDEAIAMGKEGEG